MAARLTGVPADGRRAQGVGGALRLFPPSEAVAHLGDHRNLHRRASRLPRSSGISSVAPVNAVSAMSTADGIPRPPARWGSLRMSCDASLHTVPSARQSVFISAFTCRSSCCQMRSASAVVAHARSTWLALYVMTARHGDYAAPRWPRTPP
jgi:hypothetical protein